MCVCVCVCVCDLPCITLRIRTYGPHLSPHASACALHVFKWYQSGLLHSGDEKQEKIKVRRRTFTTERRRSGQSHPETNMASTSGTRIEIKKFDGKNFALWKEMMQDVLIIRRQVEAIRHSKKPTLMTIEEWKSIDEITRSTIRMHLAENVYFSMAKETTTFKLWETLQAVYEKKSSSSKLILIRSLFNMKMRETDLATSHIKTFNWVLSELSSQGINFEEEVKALLFFRAYWQARGYYSAQHLLTIVWISTWTKQSRLENIQRRLMGLPFNDSAEAHHSTEPIGRAGWSTTRLKTTEDQQH